MPWFGLLNWQFTFLCSVSNLLKTDFVERSCGSPENSLTWMPRQSTFLWEIDARCLISRVAPWTRFFFVLEFVTSKLCYRDSDGVWLNSSLINWRYKNKIHTLKTFWRFIILMINAHLGSYPLETISLHCNVWDEKKSWMSHILWILQFYLLGSFCLLHQLLCPSDPRLKINCCVHACVFDRENNLTPFYLLCGSPKGSRRDESEICDGNYSFFCFLFFFSFGQWGKKQMQIVGGPTCKK